MTAVIINPGLSDLERERLENIRRNHEALKAAGLSSPLHDPWARRANSNTKRAKVKPSEPTRRSSRHLNHPTPNYVETPTADNIPICQLDFIGASENAAEDAPGQVWQFKGRVICTTKSTPGSSRLVDANVDVMLSRWLGRKVDDTGKARVMQLLSPNGQAPKFSKYAGIVEWKNCLVLWVNAGGSNYANTFLKDAEQLTWFASNHHHAETPVIQRLLEAGVNPSFLGVDSRHMEEESRREVDLLSEEEEGLRKVAGLCKEREGWRDVAGSFEGKGRGSSDAAGLCKEEVAGLLQKDEEVLAAVQQTAAEKSVQGRKRRRQEGEGLGVCVQTSGKIKMEEGEELECVQVSTQTKRDGNAELVQKQLLGKINGEDGALEDSGGNKAGCSPRMGEQVSCASEKGAAGSCVAGATDISGGRDVSPILLFMRLSGSEPYVCCGRVYHAWFDTRRHPIKVIWHLRDAEQLRECDEFKQLVRVVGSR